MNLTDISNAFKGWIDSFLHSDWLSTAITILCIVVVTAVCAHLATIFIRKAMKANKTLPAVSIFTNIGRVTIWVIGICVILSSCFNVNVGAAVTALGVGGIAISLGFQATLSNLIGGLQVIMTKLIEPGDRIKVSTYEGIVTDVTWRQTVIRTMSDETIVIPNSLINTSALAKLPPENDIFVDILITPGSEAIDDVVSKMTSAVDDAISEMAVLKVPAQVDLVEKTATGYHAALTFATDKNASKEAAIGAAMKAISSYAKRDLSAEAAALQNPAEKPHEDGNVVQSHGITKLEEDVHKLEHHGGQSKDEDAKRK